ncbi:MAG: hypothetical protein ABIH85_00140 [Candidatus Omnitrophota bacterium]
MIYIWIILGILLYVYALYRTSGNHYRDRFAGRIKDLEDRVEELERRAD